MKRLFLLILLGLNSFSVFAGNAWYWGKVTSIQTLTADGSFHIYIENQSIKDFCQYNRVDFMVADMGVERTKAALSMALAAFSSSKEWGVVVHLPTSEAVCRASATASQGAGIR